MTPYSTDDHLHVRYDFNIARANCFDLWSEHEREAYYYPRGYSSGTFNGRTWVHSRADKMISKRGIVPIDALDLNALGWASNLEQLIIKKTKLRRMGWKITDDASADFLMNGDWDWFQQDLDDGPYFVIDPDTGVIPFLLMDHPMINPAVWIYRNVPRDWVNEDMTWADSQALYLSREFHETFARENA